MSVNSFELHDKLTAIEAEFRLQLKRLLGHEIGWVSQTKDGIQEIKIVYMKDVPFLEKELNKENV